MAVNKSQPIKAAAGGFQLALQAEAARANHETRLQAIEASVNADAPVPGVLSVDLKGAIVAAGTPLAAYSSPNVGYVLNSSKSYAIRWHSGTLTTIWTEVDLPTDMDPSYPVTVSMQVSKTGATGTDVVSMTVAAYAQLVGSLEDASANLAGAGVMGGSAGVSPALTSGQAALPAGTVTELQVPIFLPPTPPARLSLSFTPSGTLATDDVLIEGCWLEYVRKPATPRVLIDVRAATLADGTPMAAWANNAGASAPGVTLNNSKDVCIRWNNQATLTPIFSSFELPADMDVTKPAVLVALVDKSGATVGDTMTLDVGLYEQVTGALEDATSGSLGLGGTTSAIGSPTATAKTVSKLTLGIPANTFTAGPHRVTVSVKPTDGTLGTDDGVLCGFWLEYTKKVGTPVLAIDLKAAILAAGTPMAKWTNNAGASAPGVTVNNSKAFGIRWNNFATQTAIFSAREVPFDFDTTQDCTFVVEVSKSGATLADATLFDVSVWEQIPGSLDSGGPTFSGTTTAIAAPTAAAKTISRLTVTIPGNTLKAAPGQITVSLKPHDGTNATDDVLCCGCWIEYAKTA